MTTQRQPRNGKRSDNQPVVYTGRFTQRDFREGEKLREDIRQLAREADREAALERAGLS